MAKDGLFGGPGSAGDNLLFLRLRWFLGLAIAATVALHWGRGWQDGAGAGLVGLFLLSQLLLWKLPAHWLKGLQLHTAIFLLDLFFTIAVLLVSDQASPPLLVTLFLAIFISALVRRVSLGALVGGVATIIYAAFKLQGGAGLQLTDVRQLMDIPFILISSLHTAIVVAEAGFHQDISEALDSDNQTLSRKLGSAASELKARIRFINSAFDAVPSAVLVVDGDGLLRSFNQHAEELYGVKRQAVLDKPIKHVHFLEPLRQLLRSAAGSHRAAGWMLTAKGAHFYASVHSGAARDEDGHLLNLAIFVQPVAPPPEDAAAPVLPAAQAAPELAAPAVVLSAPAAMPDAHAPAKPAGSTSSGIIQRSIALETHPDDASPL